MARCSAEIEEAENGFVVRVSSSEPDGPYESKRFVAKTQEEAQKLAGSALSGKIKVGKRRGRHGANIASAPKSSRKKTARKRG